METGVTAETLKEARERFFDTISTDKHGATCPCCERFGKVYSRKLNSAMARSLIWLYRRSRTRGWDWVNIPSEAPRWMVASREYSRMKWWDLLYDKPNENDPAVKDTGLYKITRKGAQFVLQQINIPSHVLLWNNQVVGFSDTETSIERCLDEAFHYRELMEEEII